MKKNQHGFGAIEIIIIIVILSVIGLIGWKVLASKDTKTIGSSTSQVEAPKTDSQSQAKEPGRLIWQQSADGWQASETAPQCPAQPILTAPADLSKVTSVLYPGQDRGTYKPHGGLRFDNTKDNAITVKAPIDGYIVKAARNYAEGTTEIQYNFDIMNNCGIMTRLGHLRELPADMQKIVEKLPAPSADSRIENVNPPVYVKQGTVLATKVGLLGQNTFFDWGVYDYRQQNEASKSPDFKAKHPRGEHAWYGVCWLQNGWLPNADQSTLASLNADNPASKTSDYCKK